MDLKALKKALGGIKAHELARCLNKLSIGADYNGSLKGDMLEDLASSIQRQSSLYRRITERHGSVEAWIAAGIADTAEHRERLNKHKAAKQERAEIRAAERTRMLAIVEKIKNGTLVGSADRDFFFDRVGRCILYYYRGI